MITVGIVGSGQLGWMMIMEGRRLNLRFNVIDGAKTDPAARIADRFYERDDMRKFVDDCDVVTAEFEHVDRRILELADSQNKLIPGIDSIDLKQERIREKQFLKKIGVRVSDFQVTRNREEVAELSDSFDECVIKLSSGGYDGKGQFRKKRGETVDIPEATGYVIEDYVNYDYEASIIASRTSGGKFYFHTPSINFNEDGILRYSIAPTDDFGMRAKASRIMNSLDYVGVMGIEFFIKDGDSIVNEFAPRVHNSGHHTLLGSSISQFEQHLRTILDFPQHEPELLTPSGIVNIIGKKIDRDLQESLLSIPGSRLYDYGKAARPNRKLGHVNLTASSVLDLQEKVNMTMKLVS